MAGLEKRLFENTVYNPYLWLRYLDDIFCIWTQGNNKLHEFFEYLNNFHPTIKFTMENSTEKINFLDVQVTKNNEKLETDLYCKETDRHQYLHAKSCHRHIYKKSIPFGQAIRLKRIVSDESRLNERLNELHSWIVNRGYKSEDVKKEIDRARTPNREDLSNKKEKTLDNCIKLALTYHPALSKVYKILQRAHIKGF